MSETLPELNEADVVKLMAAQMTVMDRHDLHDQYVENIRYFSEIYGVEIPGLERHESETKRITSVTCERDGCDSIQVFNSGMELVCLWGHKQNVQPTHE